MALADLPLLDGVLKELWRREGPERVGHRGPRFAKPLRELLLGEVVRLHEELVCARGLDRVEVGALKVLDEGELEAVPHVLAHDGRNGRLARDARREDTTMARDELESVRGA